MSNLDNNFAKARPGKHKFPSAYINDRIRQAAEKIIVPVKESAWEKMLVLLDKEFERIDLKSQEK